MIIHFLPRDAKLLFLEYILYFSHFNNFYFNSDIFIQSIILHSRISIIFLQWLILGHLSRALFQLFQIR